MINLNCKVDVKDALRQLADIKDKQVPFATSLAINRTAQKVKVKQESEIRDVFDRPTPYIQKSIFVKPSNKVDLTAKVGIKDNAFGNGVPAVKPLLAEIRGGERRLKKYEVALRAIGALPDGYFTVPGESADIDSYGNVRGGQIRQILSYFKANREAGYTSNSTDKTREKLKKGTKKRAGISYFVGAPGDGKSPLGIWRRNHSGTFTGPSKRLEPILIFVNSTNYEPIYDFKFVAETTVQKEFREEFKKAWELAQRTAK